MDRLEEVRSLVDQTLGSVFPPERTSGMTGPILARINVSEAGSIECDLHARPEYLAEIVEALQSRFFGRTYTLRLREL